MSKAIDHLIDESLGVCGLSESMEHCDRSAREGVMWDALLRQAEANLLQARANEALSQNLLNCTQGVDIPSTRSLIG